ncbi:MAG: DUF5711 family protein [Oscillospiraceae bacterium]|nr:DUF5711 family protein [Oscillospiraceae bacterium]
MDENVVDLNKERKKRARKPFRPLRSLLSAIFIFVVVGLVLYAVINRDQLQGNPMLAFFERLNIPFQREGEPADQFIYDRNLRNSVQVYRNGLVILSPARLAVHDVSGREQVSIAVNMPNPVLRVGDNALLSFDRGGQALLIHRRYELRRSEVFEHGIINAHMNVDGRYLLITRQPGYAAVITVYNADDRRMYQWFSAAQFVVDAALSPHANAIAVATVRQDGIAALGEVRLFNARDDSGEPAYVFSQPDGVPLAVTYRRGNVIATLWEDELILLDNQAREIARWGWSGQVLRSFSFGGDYIVLQVSRYQSEGGSTIVVLDNDGNVIAEKAFGEDIIDLDAGGGKIALLTRDAGVVYSTRLEELGVVMIEPDERGVIVRDDGSLVLLGQRAARVISIEE